MEVVTKLERAIVTTPKLMEFKIRKHTVEDMMGIELKPSSLIRRPVIDNGPEYIFPITYDKLRAAFVNYSALAGLHNTQGALPSRLDRFRWRLHRFLIKHKVII